MTPTLIQGTLHVFYGHGSYFASSQLLSLVWKTLAAVAGPETETGRSIYQTAGALLCYAYDSATV